MCVCLCVSESAEGHLQLPFMVCISEGLRTFSMVVTINYNNLFMDFFFSVLKELY